MYVNVFIKRTYHVMHATNDAESTGVGLKLGRGDVGQP